VWASLAASQRAAGSPAVVAASAETDCGKARWLGDPRRCAIADCLLLALAAVTAAICLLDVDGALRLLLVCVAACLLPGGALLTRLPVEDLLESVGLAAALGFSVEAVGTLAMIWTGWWHPVGWAVMLGIAACLTFVFDLRRSVVALGESH
jgi:hypothetical protein